MMLLEVDGKKYLTNARKKTLCAAMRHYVREQRERGREMVDITFVWGPAPRMIHASSIAAANKRGEAILM